MALERRQVVIDANLAINVVIPNQPYHPQAVALFRRWVTESVSLVAPPLFESEADGVIRRYLYRGMIDQAEAEVFQRVLDDLPISIVQDDRVRRRARAIAAASNQQRVYDATYAALAEALGCELWTADGVFHRAIRDTLVHVRFVGETQDA